jgi:hypothetical protein
MAYGFAILMFGLNEALDPIRRSDEERRRDAKSDSWGPGVESRRYRRPSISEGAGFSAKLRIASSTES